MAYLISEDQAIKMYYCWNFCAVYSSKFEFNSNNQLLQHYELSIIPTNNTDDSGHRITITRKHSQNRHKSSKFTANYVLVWCGKKKKQISWCVQKPLHYRGKGRKGKVSVCCLNPYVSGCKLNPLVLNEPSNI